MRFNKSTVQKSPVCTSSSAQFTNLHFAPSTSAQFTNLHCTPSPSAPFANLQCAPHQVHRSPISTVRLLQVHSSPISTVALLQLHRSIYSVAPFVSYYFMPCDYATRRFYVINNIATDVNTPCRLFTASLKSKFLQLPNMLSPADAFILYCRDSAH